MSERSALSAALDAALQPTQVAATPVAKAPVAAPRKRMRPLLKQLIDLLATHIKGMKRNFESHAARTEARLAALEAAAGIETKAAEPHPMQTKGMPLAASSHEVGNAVAADNGSQWKCVGPNRWRLVG